MVWRIDKAPSGCLVEGGGGVTRGIGWTFGDGGDNESRCKCRHRIGIANETERSLASRRGWGGGGVSVQILL
jgi:hypothetical protein